METKTRPAVALTDSLTIRDGVVIGRTDARGKVNASDVFTRTELQAIVQQAHDQYGITADPFATPGSANTDPAVAALVDDHSRCSGKIGPHNDDDTTRNVESGFLTVLRYQYAEDDGPAPHTANCPDPCRHDAECPHGKAWTAGETCLPCATSDA